MAKEPPATHEGSLLLVIHLDTDVEVGPGFCSP
jgi:hypothetical protein